jgi:hypothetical protein
VREQEEMISTEFAPTTASKGLSVVAGSVSLLAAVFFMLALYIFRKCRQEKLEKEQAMKVGSSL